MDNAKTKIKILGGENRNAKGMPEVYYARHIESGIVRYEEKEIDLYISNDTLKKMNKSFAGKPVYVHHQKVNLETLQNDIDGLVSESFYNPLDGWHWLKFIVISDAAKEKINQGWSVSNSYFPKQFTDGGEYHSIPFDNEITDGEYNHLAIVSDPRYENSRIMTEEEYKKYNEQKKIELSNSKKDKGVKSMLKIFQKTEVKNISDLDDVTIQIENGKEITIPEMVAIVENQKANEAKAQNTEEKKKAIMNTKIKVGDDEMTVSELINAHAEIMKNASEETEEEKKKRLERESAEAEKKNAEEEEAKKKSDEEEKLKKDEMENSKNLEKLKEEMQNGKNELKPKYESLDAKVARGKERY